VSDRKIDNPLALAVLAVLFEAPNHPYDIARLLRSRGKEHSLKLNYGSLYTVIRNLERHGFIEAATTEREGLRPERTVYRLAEAGRTELQDWMSELLGTRQKEYPRFESALALAGALHPDEVLALLEKRLGQLERENATVRQELDHLLTMLPRLFLIEVEYELAMAEAEERFVRDLVGALRDGTLDGLDGWRQAYETGEAPEAWERLSEMALQSVDRERAAGRRKKGVAPGSTEPSETS
jgi:DNA-binding PadR family transcriptional regulator